jgi:hypothetical protein
MRDAMRQAVSRMQIPQLTAALENRSAPVITLAQR